MFTGRLVVVDPYKKPLKEDEYGRFSVDFLSTEKNDKFDF
jgi:hypothetical protein